MIQRLDIILNKNNFVIIQNEDIPNWVVTIKNNMIVATALSNANKNRDRAFLFPAQEGSLFLYNSSFDFYAFFRNAKNQEILDRANIIRVHSVKSNTVQIISKELNGKELEPIIKIHNMKIEKGSEKTRVIRDSSKELKIITRVYKSIDPSIPSFIIQKGKDDKSNILYLDRNFNVKDIDNLLP